MFQALFETYQANPLILFFLIILSSYILEDLAIVAAAVIAADGLMSWQLAFAAAYIGIITGDAGLYGLGKLGQRWQYMKQKILGSTLMNRVQHYLKEYAFLNIFLIRFMPGLRAFSYVLCGFYNIPFFKFCLAVSLATIVWSCIVFGIVYQLGSSVWFAYGHYKWLLIPIMLIILISSHKLLRRHLLTKEI